VSVAGYSAGPPAAFDFGMTAKFTFWYPATAAEYMIFFKTLNSTPLSDWMMAMPLNSSPGWRSL
jgi:hypothetical protein